MAVDFEVPGTRTSEYLFLPTDIDILPEMNGRHELPDVQWIIDSILRHGQLQPITIRRTGKRPVLVAGFSRWRAVLEINEQGLTPKPIALRCSYTQLSEKQAFLANIEENRVRNQTTPIDDAYNIQRLINVYQMTEQEAAEAYRATVPWIKGRLGLLELAPEAEVAVREGRVGASAAQEIAKLSRNQQKRVVEKKGKITTADVKEVKEKDSPRLMPTAKETAIKASTAISLDVRKAIKALLAECDQQPDVMVYEIHKDTIRALRAAL